MPGRTNAKIGDQFGRWTLVEFIDSGGNGDVWRVESEGEEAALKILHRSAPADYARFRREVAICQEIDPADFPILPVLDSHLPDKPTKTDRPWYVMSFATPLSVALAGSSVKEKVTAVRAIAAGLQRLLDEHDLNHRDVKPENMFELAGRPVIGDFGLARRPDDPHLTEPGKTVGPYHHLPTEVFLEIGEPDWERVDVYCLANSMWRLLVERDYPPRGQIRAAEEDGLSRLLPDEPYIGRLALLIERATARTPTARPSLREFRDALDEWQESRQAVDDFEASYEQAEAREDAVLRWLINHVRQTPCYTGLMYEIGDPQEPSEIPGLTEGQVAEALDSLIKRIQVTGEPNHVLGRREPKYFSRLYPTVNGLHRVIDRDAFLEGEAAPLLRALVDGEDVITLPGANELVEFQGGISRSGPEAFFQLKILEHMGYVEFRPMNEGGAGPLTLMGVRATPLGRDWLYRLGHDTS